ncbi:TIGR00297 family protein [Trichothermofontia sichuanensis B231]|uniref:TIGR00297 family protein n=1 Tax=Trichothermofontia sichuanensis TaxID=3045816 RepID=UPI002245AC34|nr:TIGR00297 family protein [Trichothermofontia sichuanensis]UZQ56240.1 TIGR00297 family protein [Trichothermofontia sichuanensis B231]
MPTFFITLNPWFVAVGLNSLLLPLAILAPKKLLTPMGLAHAWLLGVLLWGTLGWPGYLVVMFYFLVGSAVTRIGLAAKEAAGIAEARAGARGPENVWGSALTATVLALMTLLPPAYLPIPIPLLLLGYVASFSTKLSDTCASEVGKAYGQRTFLITTFQAVPRGTEGAVSLEGTLAGIVASLAIATLGWAVHLIDGVGVLLCAIAALVATSLESVIGATLQTRFAWLTNEVVNGINTTIGALVAILLGLLVTPLGWGN